MPNKYDLTVYRKATATYDILVTDLIGNPVDITEMDIYFVVKKRINDRDEQALVFKHNEPGQHLSPTEGKTRFTFSSSETDIVCGDYVYDVTYINDSSQVIRKTLMIGKFKLNEVVME